MGGEKASSYTIQSIRSAVVACWPTIQHDFKLQYFGVDGALYTLVQATVADFMSCAIDGVLSLEVSLDDNGRASCSWASSTDVANALADRPTLATTGQSATAFDGSAVSLDSPAIAPSTDHNEDDCWVLIEDEALEM